MALAKVVYASMTGNTQEIAEIVADKLEDLGLDVDLDECTSVDADEFEDADLCIVATYTYGDGELPDEIVDFYEDLQDVDLSGKHSVSVVQEILSMMISVFVLTCLRNNLHLLELRKVQNLSKWT